MQREDPLKRNSLKTRLLFIGISLALGLIPFLPADLIDHLPSVCLWKRLGFNFCWGCGITRAFWHLLHGELKTALIYNWRIIIVAPILFALYLKLAYETITGHPFQVKLENIRRD